MYLLRGRVDHLIHEFIDTMTLWINLGADEDRRGRPFELICRRLRREELERLRFFELSAHLA
jgi:hypothetical protein